SDIMDFWRPTYSTTAYVDGKYSNEQYIAFFSNVWKAYQAKTSLGLKDFEAICFHLPYTKMGYKALKMILDEETSDVQNSVLDNYTNSNTYYRRRGYCYPGSLYVSLLSLLVLKADLREGSPNGLDSYGSGAVGDFLT